MTFNAPGSAEFVRPQEFVGHAFILRPLRHVPEVPGIRKSSGNPADGILLDGVILTAPGPDGQPRVFRNQTWIHSKLIGSLKNSIGTLVLARIAQGRPNPGQQSIPLELQDATNEPQIVQFAEQWIAAHPEFNSAPIPPEPAPVQQQAAPGPYAPQQYPAPAPVGYGQPMVQPAPVQPQQFGQQWAPGAPAAAPVQQPLPVAQPAPAFVPGFQPAAPAPAPVSAAPLAVMPAAAPAQPQQQVIAAAVWDALPAHEQQRATAMGAVRGA